MNDCIFCKIASGDIPSDIVMESDEVIAFRDVNPQAPVHVLVIPRLHIEKISDIGPDHSEIITALFQTGNEIAGQLGISKNGYRFVLNCGPEGGQEVYHVHLHVLGGRQMNWPPG